MLERCDCCGAYLEESGIICEKCRKELMQQISHRNRINENRESEVDCETLRN